MKETLKSFNSSQISPMKQQHQIIFADTKKILDNKIRNLTQKLKRNIAHIFQVKLTEEKILLSNYISILQADPSKRSIEDIAVIKYYLDKSNITDKMNDDGINSMKFPKMIITIATHAEYQQYPTDTTIYEYLQPAKYIYLIIKGAVSLYEPVPITKALTGIEFYRYIIDLVNNNEIQTLQALNENNKSSPFYFDIKDVHLLKGIALKLYFQKVIIENREDFTDEFFNDIKIPLSELEITDLNKMGKILIIEKIKAYTKQITNDICNHYEYLIDDSDKKDVTVFSFQKTKTLLHGEYFGNSIQCKYTCNAITNEETELCVINNYIYNEYVHLEKSDSKSKEVNFLHTNYFLNKIVKRKFEREYFNLFKKRTFKKHQYVFREYFPLINIYFIEEGTIELSSDKSILETHQSIKLLNKDNMSLSTFNNELYNIGEYPNIQSHPLYMLNQLTDKSNKRMIIVGKTDIIGVDTMINNINFNLYSAQVISDSAVVYELSIKNLLYILNNEEDEEVFNAFMKNAKIKCEIIKNRFADINSSTLEAVERTIDVPEIPQEILNEMNTSCKNNEINCTNKTINEIGLKKRFDEFNNTANKNHRKYNSNLNVSLDKDSNNTLETSNKIKLNENNNTKPNNYSISTLPEITKRVRNVSRIKKYNFYGVKSFEDRIFNKVKKQNTLIQQSLLSFSKKDQNSSLMNNPTLHTENSETQKSEEIFNVTNAFITALQTIPAKTEPSIAYSENITQRKMPLISIKNKTPYKTPFAVARLNKYNIFYTGLNYFDFEEIPKPKRKESQRHTMDNNERYGIGINGCNENNKIYWESTFCETKSTLKDIYNHNMMKLKGIKMRTLNNSNYKKNVMNKINTMYNI